MKTMKNLVLTALLAAASLILCSGACLPMLTAAEAAPLSEQVLSQWDKLSEKLGKASELRDKLPSLPESAYFSVRRQKDGLGVL